MEQKFHFIREVNLFLKRCKQLVNFKITKNITYVEQI